MEVRGQGSLVSSSRSRIVLPLVASLFAALGEQPPQLSIPRTHRSIHPRVVSRETVQKGLEGVRNASISRQRTARKTPFVLCLGLMEPTFGARRDCSDSLSKHLGE
jgi:hypothetical protein